MEYQLYINGEWKDTVTGYVAEDKNPADDSVFARVHFAGGQKWRRPLQLPKGHGGRGQTHRPPKRSRFF